MALAQFDCNFCVVPKFHWVGGGGGGKKLFHDILQLKRISYTHMVNAGQFICYSLDQ